MKDGGRQEEREREGERAEKALALTWPYKNSSYVEPISLSISLSCPCFGGAGWRGSHSGNSSGPREKGPRWGLHIEREPHENRVRIKA